MPADFDGWVFRIVSETLPRLTAAEHPESLWRPILDRGSPAHQWVERFFWYWFTNGARSSETENFIPIWRAMVLHALEHPLWDSSTCSTHDLGSAVFELLNFDARWSGLTQDAKFATPVGTMEDVFARAADKWFRIPYVLKGFAEFAIRPGTSGLLLPGLVWLATAVGSFSTYDWKYGLEETVIEFLHVCWQRESEKIANDPKLKEPFLALLAILTSRGAHAAIALRDRVGNVGLFWTRQDHAGSGRLGGGAKGIRTANLSLMRSRISLSLKAEATRSAMDRKGGGERMSASVAK